MAYIASPAAEDKPAARDLLLSALRVAAARAKLEVNLFEALGISLRQKALTCSGVHEQLRKEGLLDRIGGAR